MRQLTEGDRWHRCVQTQCGFERLRERWLFGVDPELVVHALNQLPARGQPPRDLAEDLVLLIGSRECRVGAGLTVVVAQVLISPEEPQAIANSGTAQVRRHVPVPGPLIPALPCRGCCQREHHRLAGQAGHLPIVRRVVQKPGASLSRHDIDHGALNVAVLSGRPDRLDVHFLNKINARFGSGDAVARAGEVRTVDEKLILVGAGAERRDGGRSAARRRSRRDPGGGPDEVEHAGASRRDRVEIIRAETSPKPVVPCFDARACSLNGDGLLDAREPQHGRPLNGGAGADTDTFLVIARKSVEFDVEHVRSRGQRQEAQFPFLARDQGRRAADQRR